MAGNVWEWCLTDYEKRTNIIDEPSNSRILRGGSWFSIIPSYFSCNDIGFFNPDLKSDSWGFRIVRNNS